MQHVTSVYAFTCARIYVHTWHQRIRVSLRVIETTTLVSLSSPPLANAKRRRGRLDWFGITTPMIVPRVPEGCAVCGNSARTRFYTNSSNIGNGAGTNGMDQVCATTQALARSCTQCVFVSVCVCVCACAHGVRNINE